jgi:hypothetical protein
MPSLEGGTSLLCGSFHCTGDCVRSQVMHHVTEPHQGDELALRQLPMQALRLTAKFRNLIVGTRDDRDWHPQLSVVLLQPHR